MRLLIINFRLIVVITLVLILRRERDRDGRLDVARGARVGEREQRRVPRGALGDERRVRRRHAGARGEGEAGEREVRRDRLLDARVREAVRRAAHEAARALRVLGEPARYRRRQRVPPATSARRGDDEERGDEEPHVVGACGR